MVHGSPELTVIDPCLYTRVSTQIMAAAGCGPAVTSLAFIGNDISDGAAVGNIGGIAGGVHTGIIFGSLQNPFPNNVFLLLVEGIARRRWHAVGRVRLSDLLPYLAIAGITGPHLRPNAIVSSEVDAVLPGNGVVAAAQSAIGNKNR